MGESKHTPQFAAGSHPYYLGAEPFVSATYAGQPCGCRIVGAGVSPSPLVVERCPTHAAAPLMLEALRDLAHPERRTDCNERNCGECSTCRARAAIKAATGEGEEPLCMDHGVCRRPRGHSGAHEMGLFVRAPKAATGGET